MKEFLTILTVGAIAVGCTGKSTTVALEVPEFPYQAILDSIENGDSPSIGGERTGMDPISNRIRYYIPSQEQKEDSLVDSLALYYNTQLAYNTAAYDVGTISRYFEERDKMPFINSFDSINLNGISDAVFRETLKLVSEEVAGELRKGNDPSQAAMPAVQKFNDLIVNLEGSLFAGRLNHDEYDMGTVIQNYEEIHGNALNDSVNHFKDLLQMTLGEQDFQKKCVYARELANCSHTNGEGQKSVTTIIDNLLRSGEYSPLLRELWLIWRANLQMYAFSGRSNDSAMYNLFYNDMRNRVAGTYLDRIKSNPHDKIALKEFFRLANEDNVMRDRGTLLGNNCILDEMQLYQ